MNLVFIWICYFQHNLIRKQSIEGTREGGRLGHALANLGDIDKDGFNGILSFFFQRKDII